MTIDRIAAQGFVLTPGRYVGAILQEADEVPFPKRLSELLEQWRAQARHAAEIDQRIAKNLAALGYEL